MRLSAQQKEAFAVAFVEVSAGFAGRKVEPEWRDEIQAATERLLKKGLSAAQRARFDQIMMQRRARVSPEAVCSHPAAIAALKLTPIQVQQLAAGKKLADVLTRDQVAGYDKLLGEPAERPRFDDPYLLPNVLVRKVELPTARGRDFLLFSDRLNLTETQVKKLRDLAEDEPKIRELIQHELAFDTTAPVAGAGRAQTAAAVVAEHFQATVEQQCWDVLEPIQQSIARKLVGRRN